MKEKPSTAASNEQVDLATAGQDLPRAARSSKPMDEALRLTAKVERLLDKMSPWAKEWAIKYLLAKYGNETKENGQ